MPNGDVTIGELHRDIKRLEAQIDKLETRMWVALASGFSGLGLFLLDRFAGDAPANVSAAMVRWFGG